MGLFGERDTVPVSPFCPQYPLRDSSRRTPGGQKKPDQGTQLEEKQRPEGSLIAGRQIVTKGGIGPELDNGSTGPLQGKGGYNVVGTL